MIKELDLEDKAEMFASNAVVRLLPRNPECRISDLSLIFG